MTLAQASRCADYARILIAHGREQYRADAIACACERIAGHRMTIHDQRAILARMEKNR